MIIAIAHVFGKRAASVIDGSEERDDGHCDAIHKNAKKFTELKKVWIFLSAYAIINVSYSAFGNCNGKMMPD